MPTSKTDFTSSRSSRDGARIARIVLHTTEGIMALSGRRKFFDDVNASPHKDIDKAGNILTLVPDSEKAWTETNYNATSLSIEQEEKNSGTRTRCQWIKLDHNQLVSVAITMADWSHEYGIPLEHSIHHGVCQHKDLGAYGGGHSDCGPGYPESYVTKLAILYRWRRHGRRPATAAKVARYKAQILNEQRKCGVPVGQLTTKYR